jgi:hypothetical protein
MQIDSSLFADRFWIPKGSAVAMSGGFFDARGVDAAAQPSATYLHAIDGTIPCMVLLGPPGIGKSTEFFRASREAHQRGYAAELVSLAGVFSPAALDELLFRPSIIGRAKAPCFLFLDALDESPVGVPLMQQWLLNGAEKARQVTEQTGQKILIRLSVNFHARMTRFRAGLTRKADQPDTLCSLSGATWSEVPSVFRLPRARLHAAVFRSC